MSDTLLERPTPAPTAPASAATASASAPTARHPWRLRPWMLLVLLLVAGAAMIGGARSTSATFDEILLPAAGARGYTTGDFSLVLDHPPLLQYVYGLPVAIMHPHYPLEIGWHYLARYVYARAFFWEVGNDPVRTLMAARLMAVLIALLLAVTVYRYARRFGEGPALLAAGLVAFLPDVLAHAGIAYNDVPMALAFLLGAWALDAAVRRPTLARVACAGLVCAVALATKFSAVALAPVGLALAAAEAVGRGRDRRWWRAIAVGTPVLLAVLYLGTVAAYLGDFSLAQFRFGLEFNILHAKYGTGPLKAYLLGSMHDGGVWYFFPVVLGLKTSAALQILALLAVVGFIRGARGGGEAPLARVRRWLDSPLRMPVIAALVFVAFLVGARLDIGSRHALPLFPPLCILIAVGAQRFWRESGKRARLAVPGLAAAAALSALSYYPNFLTYTSEYGPPRDRGYEAFVDSSMDWGQGLLQLRDYMRQHRIASVYLSYFGSAEPGGYGIRYRPLASFFDLIPPRKPVPEPEWVAISATNLVGNYTGPQRFARFRTVEPTAVLGNSMYLYHLVDDAPPARGGAAAPAGGNGSSPSGAGSAPAGGR